MSGEAVSAMNGGSPYFSLQEAADYARCHTRTIRRWIRASKLARHGHGRKVLVLRDQLEALLAPSDESGDVE